MASNFFKLSDVRLEKFPLKVKYKLGSVSWVDVKTVSVLALIKMGVDEQAKLYLSVFVVWTFIKSMYIPFLVISKLLNEAKPVWVLKLTVEVLEFNVPFELHFDKPIVVIDALQVKF